MEVCEEGESQLPDVKNVRDNRKQCTHEKRKPFIKLGETKKYFLNENMFLVKMKLYNTVSKGKMTFVVLNAN